ncbi:MAG: hypothetical protein DCF22_24735 [Leptolyngbya sp.]|nr:MAG: hypothetical protein DCF22_24735 [Leptolyngbya sp.]
MKRIITLGFLASLVASSAVPLFLLPSRSQPAFAADAIASSAPAQYRDVFYLSDHFGFRVVSPSGYTLTPSETPPSKQPVAPLEVLEGWQQADFADRIYLSKTPPIIRITVYKNDQRLPLTAWKSESHNHDRPFTVAGQTAISYTSTGIYQSDNVLFRSPDSRYIFRLTAEYLEPKAPIRQAFQEIVSSFTFDISPDPKAASKWRINYSQLHDLLVAKNWQAADLETRAILQRLAGSKGDLLFSSKSVLPLIPLTDLQTLDALWSKASGGRFGFSAQHRIWQQVAKGSKNSKGQAERFAQIVGWRRTQPLAENNPIGMELSGTWWRLDTELNYTATAPTGHFPWMGVSSSQLTDLLDARSLGCGSCTIDAIYLVNDRYDEYLSALFARFKGIRNK